MRYGQLNLKWSFNMRTISKEELIVVAGGDGYDFIDDEDRKSLGLSPFGNGGGAPTNFGTFDSSGTFTQVSLPSTYVESRIDTSLVCGGTGLHPASSTITLTEKPSVGAVDLSSNPSVKVAKGGTEKVLTIVCN
jgi:hypothetical protein